MQTLIFSLSLHTHNHIHIANIYSSITTFCTAAFGHQLFDAPHQSGGWVRSFFIQGHVLVGWMGYFRDAPAKEQPLEPHHKNNKFNILSAAYIYYL